MKKITVISTALSQDRQLSPLISQLKADPQVELGLISWDKHMDGELCIQYLRLETGGITLENHTHITLDQREKFAATTDNSNLNLLFSKAIKALSPELVVIMGESPAAFGAATAAALDHGLPIAHINGGQSQYDILSPSYGAGVTRLSTLHFTSCETHSQRVVDHGANPNLIFEVGNLDLETLPCPGHKNRLMEKMNWAPDQSYFLVQMEAEPNLGSKNSQLILPLISMLDQGRLPDYKWMIQLPPADNGLNKMLIQTLEGLEKQYPQQVACTPAWESRDRLSAMAHAAAVVSNNSKNMERARSLGTPVIWKSPQGHPWNPDMDLSAHGIIPTPWTGEGLGEGLQWAIQGIYPPSPVLPIPSPEQTSRKIKEVVVEFTRQFRATTP